MRDEIFILESPISMIEGESIRFCLEWLGASQIDNPTMVVYQNGKDITNKVLMGFDDYEISGNVLTLRQISALLNDGGTEYVVIIQSSVDLNIERRKLLIEVEKASN